MKEVLGLNRHGKVFLITLLLLCLVGKTYPGTTGKISGIVTDKNSGKPLPAVNIIVMGTRLGAATNLKGEYHIIQVPPGNYTLKATMMGYATVITKNVQVQVDLTTSINFQLSESAIEGEEVIVTAKRPLIQKDLTASKRSTSKEEMQFIPNAENAMDVVSLMPGTIISNTERVLDVGGGHTLKAQDENVKNIHIRGGGGGGVLFQIDGMPVNHPIFGGHSVLDIDIKAVEEIEVLTGGFNAEYGEAQSGVINIVTREGSDTYSTNVALKTDMIGSQKNEEGSQYGSFYLEGPELLTSKLFPAIGLKIPSKTTMFLSGSFRRTNTAFNNHRTRASNKVWGLFNIKDKQHNDYTFNAKIVHKLSDNHKLTLNYQRNDSWWSSYNWAAKNIPDSLGSSKSINDYAVMGFTHTLSPNTFYTLNISYLQVKYFSSLKGMSPADFWYWTYDKTSNSYKYVGANFFVDVDHDGFIDIGLGNDYRNDLSKVLTAKFDITCQINKTNLVKAGFEIQHKSLSYRNIQQGGWYLTDYGQYVFNDGPEVPKPEGPYPEYGLFRWVFDAYPRQGSWYIQDKIERSGLIINAGLRYDWFMPGPSVEKKRYIEQWETVTGLDLNLKKFKGYLSPRLGISFPISVKTVMYFSYGHFQQMPNGESLYRDPYSRDFCGNPNLEPEKTVAYEYGFAYQFLPNLAIDIKGYSKDISNTVVNGQVQPEKRRAIWLAQNMGYGRARGLEINLKKRHSDYTSGILTYTLQWANGYSSSPYQLYQLSQTDMPLPIREQRLDWDVRHQILLQFTFAVPENEHLNLFGLKVPGNWNMTFNTTFRSGNPYTPGSTAYYIPPNSKTADFVTNTDLRFEKKWQVAKIKLGITIDIMNLFDRLNSSTYWAFNRWTGKPFRYGDIAKPYPYYYTWQEMVRLRDPRIFSQGRRIVFGLNVGF